MCSLNEIENISSFSITILSSLLVGGIIMLFVDNQHNHKQITQIHIDRMRPFYDKLTRYLVFLMRIDGIIVYKDKKNEYILRLRNNIENLSKIGSNAIISGENVPLMSSGKINLVCEWVNDIWYCYENNNVKNNVAIDNYALNLFKDNIIDSLNEYSTHYANKEINISLLPLISGKFYNKVWQPVQNATSSYEYLCSQLTSLHRLMRFNIIVSSISLLVILFLYNSIALFLIYIVVVLNVLLFIYVIFKGDSIRKKIQNYM